MGIQPALMPFPETQSPPVVDIVSGRCCYNSTLGTEGLLWAIDELNIKGVAGMVGWCQQFTGHELGQTLGDGEGQGGLACWSPWGRKKLETTWWLNNNNISSICFSGNSNELRAADVSSKIYYFLRLSSLKMVYPPLSELMGRPNRTEGHNQQTAP